MSAIITMNSKVKDVYAHPIGCDVINKLLLQLGRSKKLVTNPLVSNMRLVTLAALTKKRLGTDFFHALINLLNIEQDSPQADKDQTNQPKWWKEAVFYQIYPRSFNDSNCDGIGDLPGITAKLDYLKDLGTDAIWLSPIYDSPNDDNGYDIRDYHSILAEYGTMDDFDNLLKQVHARGMRLIMDLVVNHTSDEHEWFKKALANPASPERDYYFFKKSEGRPNNWTSFFGGPAWQYFAEHDIWALCLFSKKQMDLNWENPALRAEAAKIVRFWLDKGVDGFRLDVINYISKAPGLPQGNETIGQLMGYYGIEHYFYGPRLHEYLRELNRTAFAPTAAFSVGETPGVGMQMARLLTAPKRKELDMIFSFDHLENPGKTRFDDYRYDLNYLKNFLMDWTSNFVEQGCWMSLFFENHDNPRMVSKIEPDPTLHKPLAKLLAIIQLTAKATPFIYQGQEHGAANLNFTDISQFKDVESIGIYNELAPKIGAQAAFARVLAGSRDHARAPMTWDGGNDVLDFYKQIIALRKANPAFVYGSAEFVSPKKRNYFAYYREDQQSGETFFVECNLCGKRAGSSLSAAGYTLLACNYDGNIASTLRPYEGRIYKV